MESNYSILGINKNATDKEVKAAYRKLVKEYHPDKHVSNPLAHLAEKQFKEIKQAYESIMAERKNNSDSYKKNNSKYDLDDYDKNKFNKYSVNQKWVKYKKILSIIIILTTLSFLYIRFHYNSEGYNIMGYDKLGYNQRGYDKYHYDKNGFDKDGEPNPNGEVIIYYETGQIKAKGSFKDGSPTGEWIMYYKTGEIKTKENFKDGKQIMYYKTGQIKVKYYNENFDFEFLYPKKLFPKVIESTDGDGKYFLSQDESSSIYFYGTDYRVLHPVYGGFDLSLEETYKLILKDYFKDADIKYKELNIEKNWYIVSGFLGDKIFYEKTYYIDNIYYVFKMIYPKERDKELSKYNTEMVESIKIN